ncbi:PASTA domain-containing protein [Candidatus Sumerlaeota bacterium]|nr:PASTA domain-containing protein [Candidatus Sumerlaeota bacterium]
MAAPKPMERRYLHRILLVALAFSLLFGLIVGRLYFLQRLRHDYYVAKAAAQQIRTVSITPRRGAVFSGEGHFLANSEFLETAYIVPNLVKTDPGYRHDLAIDLADCLGLDIASVKRKLRAKRDTVLARKLPESKVWELEGLCREYGLPDQAFYTRQEGKRRYPQGSLAAHVVGLTKTDDYGDNTGLSGIELVYDKYLAGSPSSEKVEVNVAGRGLSPLASEAYLRAAGNNVRLTIDEAIQHYAESALREQVEKYQALGGVCVAVEVGTGAVLAMASEPTFDPNERDVVPPENMRNRCVVDAISPGSVMKIFTATALLERNRMNPYELIDCHRGRYQFFSGRNAYRIRDAHEMGVVEIHEAFAESSNVAFAHLGRRLEKREHYDQLVLFGFGSETGIDLPGEASGIMHGLERWYPATQISVSIGYGITVTPIQVAAAVAAIANKGVYVRPHLLAEIRSPKGELVFRHEPEALRRVCSPQTSQIVLNLMEEVVTNGTGTNAQLPGYRVGGKTGTTIKDDGVVGEESEGKRYYASFVAVLPVERPRLAIYCWIDEPQGAKYGGDVAAPVVRAVASEAVRLLDIKPSREIPSRPDAIEEIEPRFEQDTLDSVLAEATEDGPALPLASGGARSMPDLRGLTIREAALELQHNGVDAQLVGWGVATQQNPAPGERLSAKRGLVFFSPVN